MCFVGFGLGCALARRRIRWLSAIEAFLALVLFLRLPLHYGKILGELSQNLGSATDVDIWSTGSTWSGLRFLSASFVALILFLLIILIFVPLGQLVSRQMNLAPRPLLAYSWNLAGSLVGILVFLAASRSMLPPSVWLGIVLLGFAFLQSNWRDRLLLGSLLVPLTLLLHEPFASGTYILWTPYQQIQYSRKYTDDGELEKGTMWVNHTGYQMIVNLSSDFLARHDGLMREAIDDNPYNLPFRFALPSPSVMIVGSGTGNDVAAALRNQSRSVDAVEIDPAILELGRREHPEHPYDSPKVSVHLTDARAFLKRTRIQYDLILFGLLDSHTQFSDYSNMRIDNFVYTEESFREAIQHLTPDGVVFVKFQVNHPWMATRLSAMLRRTFGKAPLVFHADSTYSSAATCFAISRSNRVEDALAADSRLSGFVQANALPLESRPLPLTTDDWPYLYQEGRWIPRTFYSVAVLVLFLCLVLYFQIEDARHQPPSFFFFSMGAGFLLLEMQVISRLALFFGTTWQVNGIVISALLLTLLFANVVVDKTNRPLPRFPLLAALVAGLALAYGLPLNRLPGTAAVAGTVATAVFVVPIFFAGMLFASEFRGAMSPSAALGANMLGAVAGGLLENQSLLYGMRALLLVTMGLYLLAGIGLTFRQAQHRLDIAQPTTVE